MKALVHHVAAATWCIGDLFVAAYDKATGRDRHAEFLRMQAAQRARLHDDL